MGVKHRLLDTPAEKVPHEFAQSVIDFAKNDDAITNAYVGLTEITEDFQHPREQLAAAFVLSSEDVDTVQQFAERFYASTPEEVQAGGCNVLDGPGIAVWAKQAQQVFSR
jgi:hypothetical protein